MAQPIELITELKGEEAKVFNAFVNSTESTHTPESIALWKEAKELNTIVSKPTEYEHYCPHCEYKWKGRKSVIKTCSRCKSRLDYLGKDNGTRRESSAINIIALKLCEKGLSPIKALEEAKKRFAAILVV
jgi:hypothetical protein